MSWVLARSAGARPFEINTSNKRPQQTEDGGGRKTSGHVPLCSLLRESTRVWKTQSGVELICGRANFFFRNPAVLFNGARFFATARSCLPCKSALQEGGDEKNFGAELRNRHAYLTQ